jgi:hypothetical protein
MLHPLGKTNVGEKALADMATEVAIPKKTSGMLNKQS